MSGTVEFSTFVMHLPDAVLPYAVDLWEAAEACHVDPWHLVGVMWRESMAGTAPGYKPKGSPAGTGDFAPRRPGAAYKQPSGKVYVVGSSGTPGDGGGWGRGLMQIDWGVHHEWCVTGDWKDAKKSIVYAAGLLAGFRKVFGEMQGTPRKVDAWRVERGLPQYGIKPWKELFPAVKFPSPNALVTDPRPLKGVDLDRAALAAYNAGANGVLQALACGIPAEACTAGQNYVTWIEDRIARWKTPLK